MVNPVSLVSSAGRVFGKFWNKVPIRNHEKTAELAGNLASILSTVPDKKIYFRVANEAPLQMQSSMLSIIEFIKNPSVQIHAERGYPQNVLALIRDSLSAKSSEKALKMTNGYLGGLAKQRELQEKALIQYWDRLA